MNPIFSLQAMLRTISFRQKIIPRIIPTGVFDEATLEAVMVFQREFYPPVTGVVDYGTWQAITDLYLQSALALSPPTPILGYPYEDYTIAPEEESVHLPIIQAMFYALSSILGNLDQGEVNGTHTGASVENIKELQRRAGLEPDGTISKETWDVLSRLYALFVAYVQTPFLTREEVFQR